MDSKDIKKRFLKTLPIWDEHAGKVKVQIDQLEFDVQLHIERVQASEAAYEALPTIENTTEPRRISRCKQHHDEDIVKLYRKSHSGEIIVTDTGKISKQNEEKLTVSTVNKSTIELLSSKPYTGELVYVMVDENEPWVKAKIRSVFHKAMNKRPVTIFAVTTIENPRTIQVGKFCVARVQDHGENLRVPKRVIAGPSETEMRSGIIGQEPCDGNTHRYMVLMDDGTCSYFKPNQVYPIFYQSEIPWKDPHHLGIRDEYLDAELNHYFKFYPRKIFIKIRVGQKIEVSKRCDIVPAYVIGMDCDTIRIVYQDQKEENLYKGCPRLTRTKDVVSRLMKEEISFDKLYDKLAGNIRRYYDAGSNAISDEYLRFVQNFNKSLKICGTPTARKSTSRREAEPRMKVCFDDQEVFDDRDTCPNLHDFTAGKLVHAKCSPGCLKRADIRTEADVYDIVEEFRDTCDLKVPLKLGWKRLIVRVVARTGRGTNKQFIYEAPCGKIFKSMADIKKYIRQTGSKLDVDYFTFDKEIMLNRPVGERSAFYYDKNIAAEKSGSKRPLENKFISAINPVCEEVLPLDFEYRNDTFPHPMLKAKGFSFNEEFKTGCDCEDDCSSRASCACHRLIEETAGKNAHTRGSVDVKVHYKYKRLPDQVNTGIFECNEFCKCSSKCPNRVVQNGIRVRLQVRKTIDKGWGVFTLDDIPKGTFICTYSAELLDDADQYGNSDMYYADLDYITLLEQRKLGMDDDEGVEVGDNEDDSEVDDCFLVSGRPANSKKRPFVQESDESEVEVMTPPYDEYMPRMDRYPKRMIKPVREQQPNGGKRTMPQFKKFHRMLEGEDKDKHSQDYTLDARLAGNIGRFFNHSCDASMYPQNVFISTHDLRLPVIAFFTKRPLRADDELTWHYSYTIGSIAGRVIICKCGAPNCQGRLL